MSPLKIILLILTLLGAWICQGMILLNMLINVTKNIPLRSFNNKRVKADCYDNCYTFDSEGYIMVKFVFINYMALSALNEGWYVARFFLQGKLENGTDFCCNSQDFDKGMCIDCIFPYVIIHITCFILPILKKKKKKKGQQEAIGTPYNSKNLQLQVEEEAFIDVWTVIFKEQFDTANISLCWQIYGTTLRFSFLKNLCYLLQQQETNIMHLRLLF
ncbi:hypothetical protein RFI_05711, partial [Reticulomyxa filosa]